MSTPERWIDDHGDAMYRYALKHVRDPHVAEDLVQDAFVAAWTARDSFDGRSALRTWLIGILRHKVLDHFRRQGRELATDARAIADATDDVASFDARGHWAAAVVAWADGPEEAIVRQQFLDVFEDCLSHLPPAMARALTLRHMDDIDTDELCKVMDITSTNAYVLLYRGRMRMRDCLQRHWFDRD